MSAKLKISGSRGFTLIEIMIVLVVLGLLIAVALPKVSQVLSTGKTNATKTSLSSLSKAMKSFNGDTSVWPGNIGDLIGGITAGKPCYSSKSLAVTAYSAIQVKKWKGPYMDGTTNEISVDAWGAKTSIGVVKPTFEYEGKTVDGDTVKVTDSKGSDSFNELGAVPGLYLHSKGEDTSTLGGSETGSAKDDIFVFITGIQ